MNQDNTFSDKTFYPKLVAHGNIYECLNPIYSKDYTCVVGYKVRNIFGIIETIYVNRNYVTTMMPTASTDMSVKTDANSLSYIPKKERTKEICVTAMHAGKDLSYVPTSLRDEELCSLFYKKDKENYKFIPEDIRSKMGI
jgi:hypothetical protein